MSKKAIKKITLILLTAILAFGLAACANLDPSDDGSDVETVTVKMNIIFAEKDINANSDASNDPSDTEQEEMPANVKNHKMQVEDSATVLQILQSYADQENIEIIVDESDTYYVTSINGVAEGKSSGWIYEVNGKATEDYGCSEFIPEDGDEIVWKYINF